MGKEYGYCGNLSSEVRESISKHFSGGKEFFLKNLSDGSKSLCVRNVVTILETELESAKANSTENYGNQALSNVCVYSKYASNSSSCTTTSFWSVSIRTV